MTCQQAQVNLSLYLYGELDFSQEEELEQHLSECVLCKRALEQEKAWHSTLNAERVDVPLDLLSACRNQLKAALSSSGTGIEKTASFWHWMGRLGFSPSAWSMRLAAASFLVVAGFAAGRWVERNGLPGPFYSNPELQAAQFDPSTARIRDIQPSEDNRVRIVVDQVREREITGRIDDQGVRRLLLAAAKDAGDPGLRVDSVEMLKGQDGSDVRDVLVYAVRNDPNAGVRLKALGGLRRFIDDPAAQQSLAFVLQHDDNSDVRSQAIDLLAPMTGKIELGPALTDTFQEIVRSEQSDDYVRMRCMQFLREMNALPDVY
jgi:hypothetical protein